MKHLYRVWSMLRDQPLAITEEKLEAIITFMQLKADGVDIPKAEAAPRPAQPKPAGVAVLPLFGVINQRMNLIMDFSGGTSTEMFSQEFRRAMANPEVGAVVINIDSPGGGVFGTPELAQEIFNARGKKPIVGVANSFAASAAYWIGSAVEELVVTPGGEVGSIGVYALHRDVSEAMASEGIKSTFIKAGRFKTAGNPYEPLDEESRGYMQANVDRYYDMFVSAVAKHRGVKVDQVRNGFGEGGMVGANDAVRLGMADRVATLDETLARLLRDLRQKAGAKASDAGQEIDADAWLPPADADAPMPSKAVHEIEGEARRKVYEYA